MTVILVAIIVLAVGCFVYIPQRCAIFGHLWQAANCTTAKTCLTCNTMEGTPLGHEWYAATCTSPKTCANCAKTDGVALDHSWGLSLESYKYECGRCYDKMDTIVQASTTIAFGSCGDNLAWALSENGTLTVFGKGNTFDYIYPEHTPWQDYKKKIKAIVIENGVNEIGLYAFGGCTEVTSIELADTVTYIGQNAFDSCSKLTSVTVPASVSFLHCGAFGYSSPALSCITILNPSCRFDIYCELGVVGKCIIRGYKDSTAQAYAEEHGYDFETIS